MAYGNWGAWVFRGDEHMSAWEDQTPYKEQAFEPGYHQAFGISNLSEALAEAGEGDKTGDIPGNTNPWDGLGPHHAVLGQMDVRFCGYKSDARLYLRGEQVDLDPYMTEYYDTWTDREGVEHKDGSVWQGEIEGYRFRAEFDTDRLNMIDLELVEPDGTAWTARCGYCYGSGWDDEPPSSSPVLAVLNA